MRKRRWPSLSTHQMNHLCYGTCCGNVINTIQSEKLVQICLFKGKGGGKKGENPASPIVCF